MDLWSIKAPSYSGVRSLPLLRRILDREIDKLKTMIDREGICPPTVLDVGTGAGSALRIFSEDIPVVGIDRSHHMLRRIQRRGCFTGLVGEARRLPLREGAVPFVSAVGLTEYITDKEKFLFDVRRAVCSGGFFLVTIAPPRVLNTLRNILGSRIYPIRAEKWERMVGQTGFTCLRKERTLLQIQYLLRAE